MPKITIRKIVAHLVLLAIIQLVQQGCFIFKSGRIEELRINLHEERIVWNKNETIILSFDIGHVASMPSRLSLISN